MSTHHVLDPTPDTVHWGYFDAAIPARLTVESGDTVTVNTVSGGRVEVEDLSVLGPAHRAIVEQLRPVMGPHILTGPIAVRGAVVTIRKFARDWGVSPSDAARRVVLREARRIKAASRP